LIFEHTLSKVERSEAAEQAMLDANLRLLALVADANNVRARNTELIRENEQLRTTMKSFVDVKGKGKATVNRNPYTTSASRRFSDRMPGYFDANVGSDGVHRKFSMKPKEITSSASTLHSAPTSTSRPASSTWDAHPELEPEPEPEPEPDVDEGNLAQVLL
jgi:hypothetical protein